MFTGIIEEVGKVAVLNKEHNNLQITIEASFTKELKVDQSIAHNGVCLTVVNVEDDHYTVTAIKETLDRTNLGYLKVGDKINLERCVKISDRLDGHIVQGHIDLTAICESINDENGSYLLTFQYNDSFKEIPSGKTNVTVEKGSVCVNGVSLTVVESKSNSFSVAIIPYTYKQTNFHTLKSGDVVNIEFDIIGKYVEKLIRFS